MTEPLTIQTTTAEVQSELEELQALRAVLANPAALHVHILRTWDAETIKRIALHLLGDDAQRLDTAITAEIAALIAEARQQAMTDDIPDDDPWAYIMTTDRLLLAVASALEASEAARATVTAERNKWKGRAERFREGYRDAQGEVVGLRIHEMQLQADGNAGETIRREANNARAKMLAACIERNEARARLVTARKSLKQVEPIKAEILAKYKQITGYEEVLVDLIEETLAGLGERE